MARRLAAAAGATREMSGLRQAFSKVWKSASDPDNFHHAAATARRRATPDHGPGKAPVAETAEPAPFGSPKNGVPGCQPRRASRAARGVLPVRRSDRTAPRNAGSRPPARRRSPKPQSRLHSDRRKTASQAVSQGAQAGRSEAYSPYAAATARRRATPDHSHRQGAGRRSRRAGSIRIAEKRRLRLSAKARKPGGARRTPRTPQRPHGAAQRRITATGKAPVAEAAEPAPFGSPKNGVSGRQPRRASRAERGVLPVRRSDRTAPRNAGSQPETPFF